MRAAALILAKPLAGFLLVVFAVVSVLAVAAFIALGDFVAGKE